MLCLAVTLLNSNAFGGASLIAFFFYAVMASFGAALLFGAFLLNKPAYGFSLSRSIVIFLILTVYVLLHGIATGTMGLTHYYWAANAIFLLSLGTWVQLVPQPSLFRLGLYKGVILLSLLEAIVVLLQCVGVISVPGNLYLCTGTWMNPNVTAMFLGLSLYAFLAVRKTMTRERRRFIAAPVLFIVVLAIILLQCRTAYIVASLLLLTAFWEPVKYLVKRNLQFNIRGLALSIIAITLCQILFSIFAYKQASTRSRVQIWRHSLQMVAQEPLFGHGFGMFEKEYNLYAAQQQNTTNDHVAMPYNDFIELGVEGGLIAVGLWIALLLSLWKRFCRLSAQRSLLFSFAVIQLTNFGFQAIPATTLFLCYIALETSSLSADSQSSRRFKPVNRPLYRRFIYGTMGLAGSIVLLMAVSGLMGAFYKKWLLMKSPPSESSLVRLHALAPQLAAYASFHESYGDLYMSQRQVVRALSHYLKALERTSNPDLLTKSGLCYQVLGRYDSSEYCFTMIQHMQPHRFIPRYSLLKLYEQRKDSARALAKAQEILKMPVKVRSKKVNDIKKYAKSIVTAYLHDPVSLSNLKK